MHGLHDQTCVRRTQVGGDKRHSSSCGGFGGGRWPGRLAHAAHAAGDGVVLQRLLTYHAVMISMDLLVITTL